MEHFNQGSSPNVTPNEASLFEGFDIPLSDTHVMRIDRLVNDYESRIINHLNQEYARETRWSDKLADRIAAFGGSWRFIGIFSTVLVVWVVWNSVALFHHFDPFPFILLNLMLSFIAAFQAPIIMMSQVRQASRDKHESIIDFAINYKAEQEIDDVQKHLHRIEADVKHIKTMLASLSADKAGQARKPADSEGTV